MNNPVVIGVVLAYFVLMFAIGAWANTKMKSAKEFLVAGQSLGFFVMAIASFSSIQSGWGMVGGTGQTYAWGLQALIAVGLFAPFGFAAAWFLLGSRLNWIGKKHRVYSVPDLIRVRFQDRTSHATMSVAVFIASIAYMTAQVTSIGVIISLLLGTSIPTSVWIGSMVVAAYTMAGGMLAAVWTDLVQGVLMVVMSVGLFFFAVQVAGGWIPMLDTISAGSAEMLSIDGVQAPTYIFAFGLLIFVGAVGQPQLLTKFLMLRDMTQLKWGAAVAGIAYAITTLFSVGIGLATRSMTITGDAPEIESIDDTAIWFLDSVTNPIVGGIALTGLLAAIMSSASSFITIGASSMMRDLPGAFGIKVVRELLWSRLASLTLVVLSVLLTLFLSQVVFLLGALGWAAFAAAIVGPVVMSIYWHRATATAATVTVAFAILGNMIITSLAARDIISVPAFMQVGGISLIVSILLFYVVSLLTTNRHPDATLEFLYGGPSAATDPTLTGAAAASTSTAASSPTATSSSTATSTERTDHV
ncbi:sodium:solute symporter family transporter [Dietzia psychralcaliphila]|uniref:Sodium:solute symporter n=1 Tax=Dietzia psychralcaliphila TaxID=139021 RepID=A0AAD0JTP6_9ACTN|nr:sodium:solute symporter [Dietzia psychralcaliphila]AWH96422.1 sodium:solute symporter [Dietzia psychralcaliphila]PTM90440.1 sodium/proline symporter [Dietzia psychralcaliphila]